MQTYINEFKPENRTIRIVKPNIQKVLIKDFLVTLLISVLIIALLIYLDNIVCLDGFLLIFEVLGITVNENSLLITIIILFLGIVLLFLLFHYLNFMNVRYEFYNDHIKMYYPELWILTKSKVISYENINRISYNYDGFINKLLNSGEIIIETTGMKETSIRMQIIDDTEKIVEQLLKIIEEYRNIKQMQFNENYKINNILRRF